MFRADNIEKFFFFFEITSCYKKKKSESMDCEAFWDTQSLWIFSRSEGKLLVLSLSFSCFCICCYLGAVSCVLQGSLSEVRSFWIKIPMNSLLPEHSFSNLKTSNEENKGWLMILVFPFNWGLMNAVMERGFGFGLDWFLAFFLLCNRHLRHRLLDDKYHMHGCEEKFHYCKILILVKQVKGIVQRLS